MVAPPPVRLAPPAGETITVPGAVLSMRTVMGGDTGPTRPTASAARARSVGVESEGVVQAKLQLVVPVAMVQVAPSSVDTSTRATPEPAPSVPIARPVHVACRAH